MKNQALPAREWIERAVAALFLTAGGALIWVVFSPLRPLLEKDGSYFGRTADYLGRIGLVAVLLVVALLLRRSPRYAKYGPIAVGLTVMASVVSLDRIISVYVMEYLGVDGNTPTGFALLKLNEAAVVVGATVLLTRLAGGSLGSIYLQKGNLKLGLIIGVVSFCLAAAGSFPMAALLFKGEGLSVARAAPWLPWVAVFVLANGTQEELLFRGLFLRKLEPFYGRWLSIFLVALIFTGLHYGATYSSNDYLFVAAVILLALAWGYIMRKTDSLLASALFHAGMDIPIMLGIFANLQ